MADDGGGEKKLSKKELKKLAKKAEKAQKKNGGGGGASTGAGGGASSKPDAGPADAQGEGRRAVVPARERAARRRDRRLHAQGLRRVRPVRHPPAPRRGLGRALVRQGPGPAALALAAPADEGRRRVTAEVDDWLEFEREELRPALASGNAKRVDKALARVEAALCDHQTSVASAGGGAMGPADLAISLTLIGGGMSAAALPPAVATYLDIARGHPAIASARKLAGSLLPPPPYDPSNPSLLAATSAVFAAGILVAFPSAASLGVELKSFKCKDMRHGDYQCNAAMPLYQKLKAAGALPDGVSTPQQVASAIIDAIGADNPVMEDLKVNGPGFIMSRIKASYLLDGVNDILKNAAPTKPVLTAQSGNVVVDFSSPNIAKEMHVGHLRSTIIGESVCRILEYVGADVSRVNHVGDWGTQFGMLIQYLKEEYPDFTDDVPNITDLTAFYKNAKMRFDESPEFKKVSQLNVVKLQAGDEECRKIWQVLCDVSRKEFEKVYNRLDIKVTECGESFYNDKIAPVIGEFDKAGILTSEEGGAKCVWVDGYPQPLMLQKSDGGYGYDSTDMAAIKYRIDKLGATQCVYITDFTQGDHFQMVFKAARKIGWVEGDSHRLDHIGFGTVQGEDGKRFKTRSGDTVRLVDLLDEAVSRMEASLNERIAEGKAGITKDQVHETACAMGYGAVKYFDLRRNPTSNYIFSYDRMLDTKGNTAIYLLYAHARLESIISRAEADHGVNVDELIKGGQAIVLGHKSERNLALHLEIFADCIEETLKDLYPYHICDFVYNLSIAASDFVTQCKVLGTDEMQSRVLLCRATAITMRQCFQLLGIRHVMRI
ncbi:hypothetical protein THAOC_34315 [Thalassiosira oceanica]|uniref:arginine--tRNA ligase n=1 Tax=Thalassiosira oceanica TaxID=159749 RepID=K0R2R2_THAOC|nr:hypothetical protein THAOC_34315 [Thalassiosira oceanica]|eukprot:EJK47003.1 hypothetical protein THAOC_34315 [Thalassiosira oceanica]